MAAMIPIELVLSPEGHLYLDTGTYVSECLPAVEAEEIIKLFKGNTTAGLLHLGIQDFVGPLSASFLFWQALSRLFITQICKFVHSDNSADSLVVPLPEKKEIEEIIDRSLWIKGGEYFDVHIFEFIWNELTVFLRQEVSAFSEDAQSYLNHYNPRWNLVGRVCFHLAENKKNSERPFAFLATYTTKLSQGSAVQHLPLANALRNYAGESNKTALLALLLPVQKAASQSAFIKTMIDSGSIFQATAWTPQEAYTFLKEVALMESCGIVVKIPNWWNAQKPPKPKIVVTLGDNNASQLGADTLLDFDIHLSLDGNEALTPEEWTALLNSKGNLLKIKEQWVEVDREKLAQVLAHWNQLKEQSRDGLSIAESMRFLAGGGHRMLSGEDSEDSDAIVEWSSVTAGGWFKDILNRLKDPKADDVGLIEGILKKHLKAILRPYQHSGVQWLWLLYQLRLGGCLADDMGLGKTIQILSLFLIVKYHSLATKKTHLLVVPASLLGNWQVEAAKFSPSLKMLVIHPSVNNDAIDLTNIAAKQLEDYDIVLTTYAFVHRLKWVKEIDWDLFVLDEAQSIKNPDTKQTRAVKMIKSRVKLALTGTPIENKLGDLWSLFDFTSPGLLGTSKMFAACMKKVSKDGNSSQYRQFISTLKNLTQPYILRRLKSDKKIIADLPDKMEVQSYCSLSKKQVQLYQSAVDELEVKLKEVDGIQRRGLVLSSLMRLKQICNHPTQCLGYGEYEEEESGKFRRLRELCEEIAAKQEKVLIFTQFQEIIPGIATHLAKVFGREGLILSGDTPIKKRTHLVESFQSEFGPPFFVLSLKAGGTGLTLTRASHVIHFDRWWNPAVENQATDRAYRIGQKHPVLVHKFICRGTVEEKIDALIASKKQLSQDVLGSGNELLLTELSNDELLHMVSLDLQQALAE